MTEGGFLSQRQRHPVALTAAVAINLAAVTALMLAKTDAVKRLPEAIGLIPIAPEQVPPEVVIEPEPPVTKAPPRAVDRPKPLVEPDTRASSESDLVTRIEPVPSQPGNGGTGVRVEPEPTPSPTPVLVDPVLSTGVRELQPPYPSQLLRIGTEGKAVVRVLVGTDGRVRQVAVISADDPLFAEATERHALRRWRFKPATRDGVPVESWKQLTVRFEIK